MLGMMMVFGWLLHAAGELWTIVSDGYVYKIIGVEG